MRHNLACYILKLVSSFVSSLFSICNQYSISHDVLQDIYTHIYAFFFAIYIWRITSVSFLNARCAWSKVFLFHHRNISHIPAVQHTWHLMDVYILMYRTLYIYILSWRNFYIYIYHYCIYIYIFYILSLYITNKHIDSTDIWTFLFLIRIHDI